jgi:hypothetical protein
MAKVSAHGTVQVEYFSPKRRALIRFMSDGAILYRTPFSGGWKIWGHKKSAVSEEAWSAVIEREREMASRLPAWCRAIRTLPSLNTMREMSCEGIAETPTGYRVEPDGRGPDGSPSWLLIFGVI